MRASGLADFALLAARPCPPPGELLLALAAVVGDHADAAAADDLLDDDARRLFGLPAREPADAARRLSQVLVCDLGYSVRRRGPSAFLLPEVVRRREGHPVLLAVLAHELVRRAGGRAGVLRAGDRWFVGVGEGTPALVALGGAPAEPLPPRLVRCCGHELARVAVRALADAFARAGREHEARRVCGLGALLPSG